MSVYTCTSFNICFSVEGPPEPSYEEEEEEEEEEAGRITPLLFTSPSVTCKFLQNGKLLIVPPNQPLDGQIAAVKITQIKVHLHLRHCDLYIIQNILHCVYTANVDGPAAALANPLQEQSIHFHFFIFYFCFGKLLGNVKASRSFFSLFFTSTSSSFIISLSAQAFVCFVSGSVQ